MNRSLFATLLLWAPAALLGEAIPSSPTSAQYLQTPPSPAKPRINGAKIFGVRPGSDFLFTIAATGEPPLQYSASGLPDGLHLDPTSGQITGIITSPEQTTYRVAVTVSNAHGEDRQTLRVVVARTIGLTPPLGWNSWNNWATSVDEAKVRATAQAMARLLKSHGWTYINIDDTWQGQRGGRFHGIQPNEKFRDMKRLADDVHALGLKLGLYSTPWTTSYAGYIGGSSDRADGNWKAPRDQAEREAGYHLGKYSFEADDARQWAEWGVDYLKYDWRPNDLPSITRMASALQRLHRDIFYSLSNTAPFSEVKGYAGLANAWRTTDDIRDVWDNGTRDQKGFKGIYDIALMQERWAPWTGPGHWPDPDMMVVGKVGWGRQLHDSRLSADEQYAHISLWCLWSAPMLIGCPIESMDGFTLNLLTNDEVLAIDQDPAGKMAVTAINDFDRQILVKPLEDGSLAIGLFNRGPKRQSIGIHWTLLSRDEPQHVRNLWQQKDLGVFATGFAAEVPAHGVMLLRVSAAHQP